MQKRPPVVEVVFGCGFGGPPFTKVVLIFPDVVQLGAVAASHGAAGRPLSAAGRRYRGGNDSSPSYCILSSSPVPSPAVPSDCPTVINDTGCCSVLTVPRLL